VTDHHVLKLKVIVISCVCASLHRIVVEFHKLVDFEKTGTRELKAAEFVKFCAFHRSLLYPVFSLQDKFQDRICGRKFWADLSKRRMMVADIGDYVKVEEILNAVSNSSDKKHSKTLRDISTGPHQNQPFCT
jgi:hypothetical protein